MNSAESPGQRGLRNPRVRFWVTKIASLVAAGVLTGLAYDYAAPRFYRENVRANFWYGMLHGALMPVALPALLMGQDAPIYASNNVGRFYKIGYIAGINCCGLFFFGLAFRQPKKSA